MFSNIPIPYIIPEGGTFMKIDFLLCAVMLLGGLAMMNYRLGRYYWRHEVLVKWILSLLSSVTVLACARSVLMLYCPGLTLTSPMTIILAVLSLFAIATAYQHCFRLGDRSVINYAPDPNDTYDIRDLEDVAPTPANSTK